MKREIRKVNKKKFLRHTSCAASLFKGEVKGIKKGAVKKQHLFCFLKMGANNVRPYNVERNSVFE
ncbi:MAG TPA: hypothetical protein DD364_01690 [Ruminococcaceae bacterium]|nr:hypothetical protein [Oscillospiraceae bacterium]